MEQMCVSLGTGAWPLKENHRVASTPELVSKKYQVNEEDDDVNGG